MIYEEAKDILIELQNQFPTIMFEELKPEHCCECGKRKEGKWETRVLGLPEDKYVLFVNIHFDLEKKFEGSVTIY